jgi:MFS family permease
MVGLVFMLAAVRNTGSYAVAGLAAALYMTGSAIGNPLWSRAVDRVGPRVVLIVTGLAQGALLLGAAALTVTRAGGAVGLVALAALSGALLPPLGSIMRSLWSRMFSGSDTKAAAFAFESIVLDLVFIVGPSIVALLTVIADPSLALLVSAAVTLGGCLFVATSPFTTPALRTNAGERHWLGPLRYPRVLGMLPVGFLLMGSIVVIEMTLVAFADQLRPSGMAGLLIAVLSVGGVVGGLYWGARRQPGTNAQQLMVLLVVLAAGWALLATTANPWLLAGLLALAGLMLNPAITAQFSTMDDLAPEDAITESFGWLNAVASAGSATGAAVTGLLVRQGPEAGYLLAAGMCTVAFLIALAMQRAWRVTQPAESVAVS